MKKTLLLVFIHGFKGSDDTFGSFPNDLRALLSHALPNIAILSVQYPQYETRGDLYECVAKFKEWLQNKVIDLEVANHTPSPTVDPSVHVILCGHSMGGIVAAETLWSIVGDQPVPPSTSEPSSNDSSDSETVQNGDPNAKPATSLLFPHIQGILAFDTPYLGISPGVLAHQAEHHLSTASSAYKAYNNASQLFGWKSPRGSPSPRPIVDAASKGLPAPNASSGSSNWATYAMLGGAAAAVAAAGGAAYMSRNQIAQGFSWASSHLEFVGCLAKGADLQKRVERVVQMGKTHGVRFADFYTSLGKAAAGKTQYAGQVLGEDRTFCVVPKGAGGDPASAGTKRTSQDADRPPPKRRKTGLKQEMAQGDDVADYAEDMSKYKGRWVKCKNDVAVDEFRAHTSMFAPKRNPEYYDMSHRARDSIASWVDKVWYESSGAAEVGGVRSKQSTPVDQADAVSGADEST